MAFLKSGTAQMSLHRLSWTRSVILTKIPPLPSPFDKGGLYAAQVYRAITLIARNIVINRANKISPAVGMAC